MSVVHQVAVRQHHTFRQAGSPGGVLDIGDVFGQAGMRGHVRAPRQHFLPGCAPNQNNMLQRECAAAARFFQDGGVVRAWVPFPQEDGPDARLCQHVAQFVRAVGRIDVDQHHAGPRAGQVQ